MAQRVAWYSEWVLPRSETFVAHQLRAMSGIETALFGVDHVPGMEVPGRTFVLGRDRTLGSAEALVWKSVRRAPRLESAVRAFRPDLLIAHHLQNAWRVARLAEGGGIPLAAMCHGSDLLSIGGTVPPGSRGMRQLAANWSRLLETVQLFLPVSRFLGERLVRAGAAPSRVAVHHLGVPIPDGADLGSAADRSGVLFVGRLVENKGCDLLLRAVDTLAQSRRVEVTVVGDGPQRAGLQRQADRLPPGAVVRFLGGGLPHRTVLELMKRHRVVCMPSVEISTGVSEGLGLVACEAAAHGRPAVVFDTGGLPETVVHGTTGLVVPQRDVRRLAEALDTVLTDDSIAHDMGLAARSMAVDRFDLLVQGARLRGLLSAHGLLAVETRK
ncbi:glycosyltransferase [Streptomyces ossamyceticus]|uniref:glycosyltransferase n=1 Tax=Streptomyces ossamyceticus TaxID=249581 RepID=UPI0006E2F92E|nr:glycosyltransferase [Streptomyces ossamyceticus]